MNQYQSRIQQLRQVLQDNHINAIIVPTSDPHLSEYLPAYWQGREWLSGFTGSAGTLVVTDTKATLWTDSRYWIQAEQQLSGTGIGLGKLQGGQHNPIDWLLEQLSAGMTVAIDGRVLSLDGYADYQQRFAKKNIKLKHDTDWLAKIWQDRATLPQAEIFIHQPEFVDVSCQQKLALVRDEMQKVNASHHLLSSLDDIAWLTNLRGSDVEYNPVFLSHLLISLKKAVLFVQPEKVSASIQQSLQQAGIEIAAYEEIVSALAELTAEDRLLIDSKKVAIGTLSQIKPDVSLIKQTNPSTLLKSQKTTKELEYIREAMRQDGAALCEFFAELEQRLANGERVSELDVDEMLITARSRQPHYVSPSFATIAGFQSNGALPHYRATTDNFRYLDGDGLLLIDSGAQYQNGTTDITRMVGIGHISSKQKRDVTLVLKSHIALANACFPEGIASPLIDAIARQPLWQEQLDYGHGTGHGVGYFLNVHEPPQAISYPTPITKDRAMKLGMVTSNEPALYREGEWGIRIENLVANVAVSPVKETKFGTYLCFETLTLCPIDTRLLDISLLTNDEKTWLNDYHQKVYEQLKDRVQGEALEWLTERTKAV